MAQKKKTNTADILIIGGGLAGLTAAALFGVRGLQVICLDAAPLIRAQQTPDGRTTAVSYGSAKVLKAAGVWPRMAENACPIKDIDILDGPSATLLSFDVRNTEAQAFGWIVDNTELRAALEDHLRSLPNVTHIPSCKIVAFTNDADYATATDEAGQSYRARLMIGADGQHSSVRAHLGIRTRSWDYHQTALVCTAHHTRPHHGLAVEHFRAEGPFAVLPMMDDAQGRHRSSVVWTEHGRAAREFLHCPEDVFNAALQARFPARYGDVQLVGSRFAYPLTFKHAYNYIGPRTALVAEAAHRIHPIAGQGLNLGLRDIGVLAGLVDTAFAHKQDIGSPALLESYQRARRPDNVAMAAATDAFVKLFSTRLTSVGVIRRMGVRMVEHLPFAKKFFVAQAMGEGSPLPDFIERAA